MISDTIKGEFTFGNGNANDDFTCEIEIGSSLKIKDTVLNYKNIDSDSWDMENQFSRLIIESDAKLSLHETLDVTPGIIQFGAQAILARASGASLLGSAHVKGKLNYEAIV